MMKKTLLSFAFVATSLLVSCQGQIEPSNQKESADGAKVFTASIDNALTRTTLVYSSETVTYPVNWAKDDLISINGKSYKATTGGSSTSSFTAVDGDATENSSSPYYEAYYPSSIYNGDTPTLPSTVTYDAAASYLPMYAATTEKGSTSFTFKNICAVLAVKVTSADIATLKAIKVKSDKAMCGAFTVSDDKAQLTDASDASKAVTLVSSTALTLDATGITFYIAIPAQEYSFLEVYLSSDGTAFTQMMCTKKKDGLGAIAKNTVYLIDYKVNAVQLWADGPYWATTNIGADTSADAGLYFAWGDVIGQTWNDSSWSNGGFSTTPTVELDGDKLKPAYDAATQKWGTGWSVPTNTDLTNLINSSNLSIERVFSGSAHWSTYHVNGLLITGKGDYARNSIFLPAVGYGYGSRLGNAAEDGNYWSSVQNGSSSAYGLSFNLEHDDSDVDGGAKSCGYSVRPVRSSL